MGRTFETLPAVRRAVPLWIGIVGCSGSGKTLSALRLATGMSKVYGDGVYFIDTEARRSSHYADDFKFSVLDFKAPFGPLDYLEAIKHCVAKGAKTVVVDSMSHEWEGEGGVLEQHESECERLVKEWRSTRDKVQMSAWGRPKGDHRKLLGYMLQSGVNYILCYRAKEKLKIVQGRPPQPLGWQPVGPDDLVYEATVNMLLFPGSKGHPEWLPGENAEKELVKLPRHFEAMFKDKKPLDEATGEALARWAAGGAAATGSPVESKGASASTATPLSAVPATATKASAAALDMLSAQLGANGIGTKEARREWFLKATGKTIAEATEADVALAIETAENEVPR